jgi:hypothetical protein
VIECSSLAKAILSLVRHFYPERGMHGSPLVLYAEGHAACGHLSEPATAFPD